MTWQFYHFRTMENGLSDVPNRFKTLPVYLTEANLQVKSDKPVILNQIKLEAKKLRIAA